MPKRRNFSAFILAGGASSRMGRNKALLDLGGTPSIVRTARMIEPLVGRVTVIGPPAAYAGLGLRVIPDRPMEKQAGSNEARSGPLAGIATALGVTHSTWNLIVACDLPYLTREWVKWMIERARRSGGQVVIPRTRRGLEPLAALYRRECGPAIAAALARGERKVSAAIAGLRMDIVPENEWCGLGLATPVLRNMNTRKDYLEALRRAPGAANWAKQRDRTGPLDRAARKLQAQGDKIK